MLKVSWEPEGTMIDEPAVVFGFDTTEKLFADGIKPGWLNGGFEVVYANNLVITGVGAPQPPMSAEKARKGSLKDGTARDVYPLINNPALPFRAGLTIHAARGTWSSLPHEFEREEILLPRPRPFYEKFAYVTLEPGGWGVQYRIGHLFESPPAEVSLLSLRQSVDCPENDLTMQWVNDVVTVRDRDILDIPLGSHPSSGGPGVKWGYFWVYWGDLTNREKF